MSRGNSPRRAGRPGTRPADPCAFCGVRVPRLHPTDEAGPKLCAPCDNGSSYQFTVKKTVGRIRPFAESRWREPDLIDAGRALRFGTTDGPRSGR